MTPGPAPQRRARRAGAARRLLSPKDAHAKAFLRIVCRGVWTGLRMAGLDGVSGLRPGLESPLLRHWRSGTGRRRKDEGEACRQALPRRCQTGACPGRQLRSLWDAVPEAGQRLADAADSRRGRKGCMPEQTATGAGFRQSASGAMATGTAQERGWLAGGTSSPLPASKAILVLGKQGQHASRLRDKAGFLPAPVQARSRAGPDPLLNSSSPPRQSLRIPSEAPRRASDSLGQPRTVSDRAGSALGSAEPCRLEFVLFQTVPKKQRRHWISRIKRALPPPSAGPADPCGKRTHAESGRGEASGNMELAHGAQAPPEAGRRCSSSLQSLAPQASARARA